MSVLVVASQRERRELKAVRVRIVCFRFDVDQQHTHTKDIEKLQQLELFEFDSLSVTEKQHCFTIIRQQYWHLRNLRKWQPNDKIRRRHYRLVEVEKKRLRLAGVSKEEINLFLCCCRERCKLGKDCPFCRSKFT